jgi:glycine/D-amino acid oxidase-like deaminating enzyme
MNNYTHQHQVENLLSFCYNLGYNWIVNMDSAGLNESDFPSRVITDSIMYTSTLNKELRIASFGEFDGWDTDADPSVVSELKEQACRMYPRMRGAVASSEGDVRTGLRPFVSDGRLLLGKIPQYHNLYVNVGPGFNGWKVATGAAKVLVADITGDSSDIPNSFDAGILSPENRIVYSPWFCHLTNFLVYNY